MKKTMLIFVVMILSVHTVYSDGFGNKEYYASLDFNGINSNSQLRGARLNYSFLLKNYLEGSLLSIATQYDGDKVRVSANGLFSAVGGIGLYMVASKFNTKTSDLYAAATVVMLSPLILQMITNPMLKIPLVQEHLDFTAGIRTDYFLFNTVARIYSEGTIGLRGRYGKTALEVNAGVPFTKGYFDNKTPYVGARFFYIIGA